MKRRLLQLLLVVAGVVFLAAGLHAGTDVKDVVKMENKAYKKHKKAIVVFTHKKHAEDYAKKNPDLYKNGCGECHHNDKGKPLSLKMGDDVQNCIECHKNPSRPPTGKDKPKLSKKEKLEYHAYAIHKNCKDCHKKFKNATKSKAAPTTCTKCHPKKKK